MHLNCVEFRHCSVLKGKKVYYNGNSEVETTDIPELETGEVILVSKGKDHGKKSDFRLSMDVSPQRIDVAKSVKYHGTQGYFQRTRHVFESQ